MDKDRKKRLKKTVRTNVPGVSAVINSSEQRLSGYLVDARNNVPLDQDIWILSGLHVATRLRMCYGEMLVVSYAITAVWIRIW